MKSRLVRFAMLGASAVLALSLSSAQAQNKVTTTVPFDFVAGSLAMPAGECATTVQNTPALVQVECGKGHRIFLIANYVEPKGGGSGARLVFNRYGDRYFLSQIWPGSGEVGRVLIPSPQEREVIRTTGLRATTVILASR